MLIIFYGFIDITNFWFFLNKTCSFGHLVSINILYSSWCVYVYMYCISKLLSSTYSIYTLWKTIFHYRIDSSLFYFGIFWSTLFYGLEPVQTQMCKDR